MRRPVTGSSVEVRMSRFSKSNTAKVASSLFWRKEPLRPASYCWPFCSEKSALVVVSETSWVTGSEARLKEA